MGGKKRTDGPIQDPRIGQFRDRLRVAIGSESVRSFAGRAGVTEGTVRRILADREPTLSTLLRIADAAGVSSCWLITGEESSEAHAAQPPQEIPPQPFEMEVVKEVLFALESALRMANKTLKPQAKAEAIGLLYLMEMERRQEEGADAGQHVDTSRIIEFARFAGK